MRRRSFVTGAGVLAGVAAAQGFPKPAIAQSRIEWKMVTSWPKGLPGLGTSAERLAERIDDLSGGRLKVKVYPAGELVGPLKCFDAVSRGDAEMAHDAAFYHIDQMRAAGFFAAVPFGLTAQEFNGWVSFAGGQELWDELYDASGVKPFLAGNTGCQMGGWYRSEMRSIADFKGKTFCVPGYAGEILRGLGAQTSTLASGQIFGEMQAGTIDGAEWVGPYNDLSLGLYKITKLYYWPGFQEPGSALECIVNKAKFRDLPDDLKRVVAASCAVENELTLAEYAGRSPGALATLVNEYKVQLKKFPRDMLVELGRAASKLMQDIEGSADEATREIARSYLKYRRQALQWTRIAEGGFIEARDLPFSFPSGDS